MVCLWQFYILWHFDAALPPADGVWRLVWSSAAVWWLNFRLCVSADCQGCCGAPTTQHNNSKQSLVKPVASACKGSKGQEVNRYKGESVLNNGGTLTLQLPNVCIIWASYVFMCVHVIVGGPVYSEHKSNFVVCSVYISIQYGIHPSFKNRPKKIRTHRSLCA